MTARSLPQMSFVVALICALSGGLAAQGKKNQPPADVPGSFTMPGPHPCESTTTLAALGACGDALGDYEADSDGTYVILNVNRERRSGLSGARFVTLHFSQPIEGSVL